MKFKLKIIYSMEKLTEVKDFNIIKFISQGATSYTYLAISKSQQNNIEEYYKILKLRSIEGIN